MFRWVLVVAAILLLPYNVYAQCCGNGLVRSYPLDHSGAVSPLGAKMWIDFEQAVAGTVTSSDGEYTFSVTGTPERVTDGTWPHGLSSGQGHGWKFDNDPFLHRASDGTFNPDADFSVMVVYSSHANVNDALVAKWDYSNQQGWQLTNYFSSVRLYISSDGSTSSYVAVSSMLGLSRPSCIVATYDQSATTANLYVDGASGINASMPAHVYASTADMTIASALVGGSKSNMADGTIHHVAYWDRALTADEAQYLCAQYRGVVSTAGNIITTSSTSPPALTLAPPDSGTEPFVMDMPSDTIQIGSPASGSGGLYGASAITNFVHRASFETWASSTDVTGWTEGLTAGDGTAAVNQNTDHMAHGANSVEFVLTGTTSEASVTSACLTGGIGSDAEFQGFAKSTNGTSSMTAYVTQYSSADCSGAALATTSWDMTVSSDWSRTDHKVAAADWDGTAASYTVSVKEAGNGGVTSLVDAIQFRAANYPSDAFCLADTDASAACTTTVHKGVYPLHAGGDRQIKYTARAPWNGTDWGSDKTFFRVQQVSSNSFYLGISASDDEPFLYVYDYAGAVRWNTSNVADWSADTDYQVGAYIKNDGRLALYWNDAWDTSYGGAGTGLMDTDPDYFYPTGNTIASYDTWTRNLKFWRVIK